MRPPHKSCTRSGCSRAGAEVWDALSACPSCHTPYAVVPSPWKAVTVMTIRKSAPAVRRVLNRVPRPKVTAGRVCLAAGVTGWVVDGVHVVTSPLSWSTFDQGAVLVGAACVASLVATIRADRRANRAVQSLVGWVAYPSPTEDEDDAQEEELPFGRWPAASFPDRTDQAAVPGGRARFTVIQGGAAA